MKILANENIAGDIVNVLRANGHDVLWVKTDFPGADDDTVLARASLEQCYRQFQNSYGSSANALI